MDNVSNLHLKECSSALHNYRSCMGTRAVWKKGHLLISAALV